MPTTPSPVATHAVADRSYDVAGLTDTQLERRRSILDAASRQAEEGGYAGVHIRAVASEAGVALGTLYKYFESKDHLLAALLVDWVSDTEVAILAHPSTADTAEGRLLDMIGHALGVMSARPEATRAVVTALYGPSTAVAVCQSNISATMGRILAQAFDSTADPLWCSTAIRSIEHVWFSAMLSWANGWIEPDQVRAEIAAAVRHVVGSPAST